MGLFKRKEVRAEVPADDALLSALFGGTGVTKSVAMQISTISGAVELISNVVASTPIKLYDEQDGMATEVKDDVRVRLLNDETGDTLTAHQFWKAIIPDYYLGKGGYAYINKERGKITGVFYVDESKVSIMKNSDPIFKDYDIMVNGKTYKPFDFIKILRNSKDGSSGQSIITENDKLLEVIYEALVFESNLVKKGGNKKGFLKSENKLTDDAMKILRTAFSRLYSNNTDNVVVLNKGIDFVESSNTSVEMQLNENKRTNAEEVSKIFHVAPELIFGKATKEGLDGLIKLAAMPLFKEIESSLNRDFLFEKEKGSRYWAFDTKSLLKGDIKERMEAYKLAIDGKIMSPNEVRFAEDLPNIDGLDIINMGLADVIYDIKTKAYFTPNTKTVTTAGKEGFNETGN